MNKKVILGIAIGVLVLVVGVIAGLTISHEEKIPDAARIEEYVDSILPWKTIITQVPKVADHEVHEFTSIRGKPTPVIITSDSPILWLSSREVSEDGVGVPGGFHCFAVLISFWESEAALQEEIRLNSETGYKIQEEGRVTAGFFEEKAPFWDGRDRNLLKIFVAKGRLRVKLVVTTYFDGSEGEPFAEREDLEELIEIVKENLLEMNI